MKKAIFTLFALFTFTIHTITAQTSGGPDTYGYIWKDNIDTAANKPVYNWIDIKSKTGAVQVTGLSDDNAVGPFTIGFPFHYYWYDVTKFWIGSNGYIGFTSGTIAAPFPTIPSAGLPQNYIAAFASDLNFSGLAGDTAECWYWKNTNNDTLIVSWQNVGFWVTPNLASGQNTFQIILSAVDSSITMQYKTQNGTSSSATNFSTIGIENISGSIGLQHSHDVYFPSSGYSIKYYYPSQTTYQVSDAAVVFNNNPETGGLHLNLNSSSFLGTAEIKNTGNQKLNPFNVYCRVVNSGNAIQVRDTIVSDTLDPGETQTISMIDKFMPAVTGTFRFIAETRLVGDATTTNNTKTMELVVIDSTSTDIRLSFDANGAPTTGLSWQGGTAGAGIEFVPPFYPFKITKLHAYIIDNTMGAGFYFKLQKNDGPSGAPGTLLDSVFVDQSVILVPGWHDVTLATPIDITTGNVYLAWMMYGESIILGTDPTQPISNRTYEVFGNSWSAFRNREIEDLMLNVTVQLPWTGIEETISLDKSFGEFYPNPASDIASIGYDLDKAADKISWTIYSSDGKLVQQKELSQSFSGVGKINISVKDLATGNYFCVLKADEKTYVRKLSVVK